MTRDEMITKTVREYLAETFPLHFQRMLEAIYEQRPGWFDDELGKPYRGGGILLYAFLWNETPEGEEYWDNLERAENVR